MSPFLNECYDGIFPLVRHLFFAVITLLKSVLSFDLTTSPPGLSISITIWSSPGALLFFIPFMACSISRSRIGGTSSAASFLIFWAATLYSVSQNSSHLLRILSLLVMTVPSYSFKVGIRILQPSFSFALFSPFPLSLASFTRMVLCSLRSSLNLFLMV